LKQRSTVALTGKGCQVLSEQIRQVEILLRNGAAAPPGYEKGRHHEQSTRAHPKVVLVLLFMCVFAFAIVFTTLYALMVQSRNNDLKRNHPV
jgi:hypothetical protein